MAKPWDGVEVPPGLVEALREAPTRVYELPAFCVFVVVSQLQLALRHPEQPPHLRTVTEEVARDLQNSLPDFLCGVLEAGWDVEQDVLKGGQ